MSIIKRTLFAVALTAITFTGLYAADKADTAKAEKGFTPACPISGAPADKANFVKVHGGKKVYFCCPNCPEAFKADRKKYAAAAHLQLLGTGQITQVACPLTGRPVAEGKEVTVGGVEVGFCCPNCQAKVAGLEAGKQIQTVFASLNKGFTLQTACPVSGKKIDPAHSVTYKGEKVYFCCPNCPKAFEANPEKFEAKVPQLNEENKKES